MAQWSLHKWELKTILIIITTKGRIKRWSIEHPRTSTTIIKICFQEQIPL